MLIILVQFYLYAVTHVIVTLQGNAEITAATIVTLHVFKRFDFRFTIRGDAVVCVGSCRYVIATRTVKLCVIVTV